MTKKYPVWRIAARWNQADYQNNGTSFEVSFRRKLSEASVKKYAERWWKTYCKSDKMKGKQDVELLELDVKYLGTTSWFMSWFAHKSLTRFDTEKAAFADFERYLNEEVRLNYDEWNSRAKILETGYEYCPMGAEDRWRWKLCRCDHCLKGGWTIITH